MVKNIEELEIQNSLAFSFIYKHCFVLRECTLVVVSSTI